MAAADLLEPDVLGGRRPHGARSPRGTRRRARSEFRDAADAHPRRDRRRKAWNPELGSFVGTLRRPRAGRRAAADGAAALAAGATTPQAAAARSTRSGRACRATAGCSATARRRLRPARRSRSRCARSGWSRRSRAIGRDAEARAVMERVHAALSPLGLLSEDYETGDAAHVGQLPAGLLARRPDPRRLRGFAELGRSAMS